jgi:Domain of unknown function (DUF4190)
MALRFNPPPGWPPPPPGFTPAPGWQPDPSWPPQPAGWQLWVEDTATPSAAGYPPAGAAGYAPSGPPDAQLPAYPPYGAGALPPGMPGPGAPKPGTNGFAIASLIFGVLGGVILSPVFGLVALSQIRRRPQAGRGLAVTGLVLSGLWIAVIGTGVVIALATSAQRSATGRITGGGSLSIFDLKAGDCFQNPSATAQADITDVTAVPCTTAHDAQAFATFSAAGTTYPRAAALREQATTGCRSRAARDLIHSKITSTMSLHFLYPGEKSWSDAQYQITCLVVDSSRDMTSSLVAPG